MNIIILGAPGVGKGTYTDFLIEDLQIPHISTGQMFRDNFKLGTPLGITAKGYTDKGQLVPDELTIEMLKARLEQPDTKMGYILDGFPRTIPQAEAFAKIAKVDVVLNFTAPEAVILDRLSGRRTCRKCGAIYHIRNIPPKQAGICDKCGGELYQRDDEKEGVVKARLLEYEKKTAPLVGYYKRLGLLHEVDSGSPISEKDRVIGSIKKILGSAH